MPTASQMNCQIKGAGNASRLPDRQVVGSLAVARRAGRQTGGMATRDNEFRICHRLCVNRRGRRKKTATAAAAEKMLRFLFHSFFFLHLFGGSTISFIRGLSRYSAGAGHMQPGHKVCKYINPNVAHLLCIHIADCSSHFLAILGTSSTPRSARIFWHVAMMMRSLAINAWHRWLLQH